MRIKEIYIRDEKDPYYESGIVDYQNDLEYVISQIRMILGTKNGDVLGMYNFGVDLEYAVFNTKKSAEQVANKIEEQINEYVWKPNGMDINVAVSFGDSGKGYDYAVIDILIDGVKAVGFLVDKS